MPASAKSKAPAAKAASKANPLKSKDHVFLIDGSGYIFRAFFALPPMTRPDGTPVNAVFGFANMLFRLMQDTPRGDDLVGRLRL